MEPTAEQQSYAEHKRRETEGEHCAPEEHLRRLLALGFPEDQAREMAEANAARDAERA